MQNVSCPSCGARVQFKSHASVMAVCEYCKTTVLKDADTVKDFGRMSDVLDDYSPIQVGTAGRFGSQGFTVIGRIQLRYDAGLWNEWYVLFDDGNPGWLSDASGQYTLTFEKAGAVSLLAFKDIHPASLYHILGENWIASDIRVAECTGGQGELPFRVGQGWTAKVADFRRAGKFLTLDYSETDEPKVYAGQSVTLDQLKCQFLRDEDTIRDSAGKIQGRVDRLGCPSCGSNVSFVPGVTTQIICPSCRAEVDTSTRTAVVLQTATRMNAVQTSIELGAKATISGAAFEVIGAMRRRDDENSFWTEYLMYSPRAGFFWLVETEEGWFRADVLDEWPEWNHGDTALLGGQTYRKRFDYSATVDFAAGAFNWRVHAGDKTRVTEFALGKKSLAAELTVNELTWSQSTLVPADQMRAWFGTAVKVAQLAPRTSILSVAKFFLIAVLVLNAIPLLLEFGKTWEYVFFACAAIYAPAWALNLMNNGES
jgi:ribosomal protein L37AE/L43A